jgi:hypothetical protein
MTCKEGFGAMGPALERTAPIRQEVGVVLDAPPNVPGSFFGVQAPNEMQGHVDPGRYSGRGDHVPGVDEPIVGADVHVSAERGEQAELVPVGRGRPPVQKAGVDQDERPRCTRSS